MPDEQTNSTLELILGSILIVLGGSTVVGWIGQELGFWEPEPPIPPEVVVDAIELMQQGAEMVNQALAVIIL